MLNELYQLSRNLQKCGVQISEPEQDVQVPGKGKGLIVGINQDGLPEFIEYVENMAKLWTLRKWNKNSFPFMKLKKPILAMVFEDQIYENFKGKKVTLKQKKTLLTEIVRKSELSKKQNLSITPWATEKIDGLKAKDVRLNALVDLAGRFPKDKSHSVIFLTKLTELLLQNIQDQTIDLIKKLLIGDKKEKDKKIICDVPLFFDVSDWSKYQCRVAHPDMGKIVGQYLSGKSVGDTSTGTVDLIGYAEKAHTGNYPKPKLPAVGQVCIFSMNKDAKCHYRYKRISSEIFPTHKEAVKVIHGALEWCVADERKGKTWQGIPNIKREQDLLISYLEEKPENAIELASIFAASDVDEGVTAEAAFENKTKTVCAALKGEAGLTDNSQVNVMVISNVDKGRAQVVLSAAYTIKNIVQSVEEWRIAADNRPPFSLWLPGKKGERAFRSEPSCPSPVDVMKCLQNQWIKNGIDKRNVPGVYLRHVYDLYLGSTFIARLAANNFMNLALQRLGELFIGYAGADHSNNIKEYLLDARKTVLNGISILAIVLYKLGIEKEDYMKNAAFSVGRMLALADKLHYAYCWKVRKKVIPPQLIGNAIMRTALDNPVKGLSLLSERLPIYQAWATNVQDDGTDENVTKQVRLAKWVLGQMGQVSADMENVTIPTRADDAVKAQMLLGYLAHVKNEA